MNNTPVRRANTNALTEKLFREEKNYRSDRLVEKWSNVAEVGKGIKNMDVNKARNLAILLENQTRAMSRMSEAQLSSAFGDFKPENMLRLIRLSYPNSCRGEIFTEFNLETANDSIKYVYPVYGNGLVDGKYHGENGMAAAGRFDVEEAVRETAMYESSESQFATEFATVAAADNITAEPFKSMGYVDGHSKFVSADGKTVYAMQAGVGHEDTWLTAEGYDVTRDAGTGKYTLTGTDAATAKFVGAYDSEKDLAGQYLGEVELVMKDYHFNPRPIALGVTWTQLTELVLDTSFGVSAEEMLLDSAAQEIKKTLDFQAVKYANAMQKMNGIEAAKFDAEAGGNTKDSYWHTAQTVTQAFDKVINNVYNDIKRGGITNIVASPSAASYLKLNENYKATGRMPAIGIYKVGEIDGIGIYKAPADIIPEGEILTTWKNEAAEGDVSVVIGTLLPFFSTGAIQRKNFYKEAGISRYEDTKALQPKYLGRIQIENIR
jgi:hypothetical protein